MNRNVKKYDELTVAEQRLYDDMGELLMRAEEIGKEDLAFHLEVAIMYLLQREDRTQPKNMHMFSECVH